MDNSLQWTEVMKKGCTRLHYTIIHESGHALGLNHTRHETSILRPGWQATYPHCGPTVYDEAAMMTNYQSR